jgi:hypothetical protein
VTPFGGKRIDDDCVRLKSRSVLTARTNTAKKKSEDESESDIDKQDRVDGAHKHYPLVGQFGFV